MAMLAQKDMVGDQKMLEGTGRMPDEWFALLDAAGAMKWTHTSIAAWLRGEHQVPRWWNQAVTVRYEQARGMREPGQKADGTFAATATRTVDVDATAALEFAMPVVAGRIGDDATSVNRGAKTPNARWTLVGRERLLLTATPTADGRSSIGLTHSGITDPGGLVPAKAGLRELLVDIDNAVSAKIS